MSLKLLMPALYPNRFADDGTVNFGYFDVMLWPGALKDLKLTSNTWSNQLPAAVVYEKGKEVARLPSLATAEQQARRNHFTKVCTCAGWRCT